MVGLVFENRKNGLYVYYLQTSGCMVNNEYLYYRQR